MRENPEERLREAAQTLEDVGSEVRSGDHVVDDDREEIADILITSSSVVRKLALVVRGLGDGEGDA